MIRQAESVDYSLKKKGIWPSALYLPDKNSTSPLYPIQGKGNSEHLHYPLLDLLQPVYIFLVLRTSDLDAIFEVGSHKDRGEQENNLPQGGCLDFLTQNKIRAGNL